jgi:hypothetical protein
MLIIPLPADSTLLVPGSGLLHGTALSCAGFSAAIIGLVGIVNCYHCGAENPAEARTCLSCGIGLEPEQEQVSASERAAMYLILPTAAIPPSRDGPPVEANDIANWSRVVLFVPYVGLVLTIIWIIQRRPGAWGCLVLVIIYTAIVTFGPYLIYLLAAR